MLRYIFRKIQFNLKRKHKSAAPREMGANGGAARNKWTSESQSEEQNVSQGDRVSNEELKQDISSRLKDNIDIIKRAFAGADDIRYRNFPINARNGKPRDATIVFIDGLAKSETVTKTIVEPFLYGTAIAGIGSDFSCRDIEALKSSMLSAGEIKEAKTVEDAVNGCFDGDTVLFIDGFKTAIIISTKGYETRSIETPQDEVNVRGPKESFVESLRVNTSLIRRKIKNTNLKFDTLRIGKQSKTTVSISYIRGIADEGLVDEVKRRLGAIDIDGILDSSYVEQLIEDAPFSIFETTGYSERPDVVASKLLEGRVAIIVDGSPNVLTAPYLFLEAFQVPSDYYERPLYSTIIRCLRMVAFLITIMAPAVYVALTTFHQEFLPSKLMITMVKAREGIPFSAFFEALTMLFAFEILKEAGLRLPKSIGQTISIVGALIIGEAAVSAGIVSAPLVIVIAFTAVSGFVVSFLNDQEFILRLVFLIMGGVLGGYGIAIIFLMMLVHLASLKSFGYRYLSPFMPMIPSDQKDYLVRAPLWLMRTRPKGFAKKNPVRENSVIPPRG